MREPGTIEQLVEEYEVTREVLHFRSADGLSIADYYAILNLPNASRRFRMPSRVGEEYDSEMTKLVGEVRVGSKPVYTFRQLWGMFLQAREELFDLFANMQPDWHLEDIILIQDMLAKGVIVRNLHVTAVTDTTTEAHMFAVGCPSNLLNELLAASYMPPNDELRDFFVKHVNHKNVQALQVSIYDVAKFARSRAPLGDHLYQHFTERLPQYINEIGVRHWENLAHTEWQMRVARVNEKRPITSDLYLDAMRTVGIPDEITLLGDPEIVCRRLTDVVKNGNFSGKILLEHFWLKDNSRDELDCSCVLWTTETP